MPQTTSTPQGAHEYMGIIGQSDRMQQVFRTIDKVADSDSTIVLHGESGTGKGLVAKAIHTNSHRKVKPFVPINCGAIPETLLESELFGHVRGAFTGATFPKPGKFELADGGTIFLDEIGDMSAGLQVKILRVLEDREFEQVGGCKTIRVDVRVIAATHRDLEEEVDKGNFREDLYYRLNVIPITLPPLRERKSDISLMVDHFLHEFNVKNHKTIQGISDSAMEIMTDYSWPGNVRELKNVMERVVVLKETGHISPHDLPHLTAGRKTFLSPRNIEISDNGICLNTALTELEKALILQSLEKTRWVKNKAAKLLRLNRTTLVEKIKRHHLDELKECSM
ncbi:MAG: sigma-54 dependent transcriptional regulator [Thermodesulfobacteriota bacterium]|nr:sigma-54 dependent transcriptional regulator [Thermodesulfobacteriota bacterium]